MLAQKQSRRHAQRQQQGQRFSGLPFAIAAHSLTLCGGRRVRAFVVSPGLHDRGKNGASGAAISIAPPHAFIAREARMKVTLAAGIVLLIGLFAVA